MPELHLLRSARMLSLDARTGDALHLVRAAAPGAQVSVPAGWLTLGLVLRGTLDLRAADQRWSVGAGEAFDHRGAGLDAVAGAEAGWLLLAGPTAAWTRALPPRAPRGGGGLDALVPLDGRAPRPLARALVHTARRAGAPGAAEASCTALASAWLACSAGLQPLLARCSGRTPQRRQQTLLRLLRVRQRILRHAEQRPTLDALARGASYSPHHLIRVYRAVFGETPSEYAARLRLERAWRLVSQTRMPICEITEAMGFESQSAFCRAFKQTYGITATQVREAGPPHAVAACAA